MKCNRLALSCALYFWEAVGFSPSPAGNHMSNFCHKESTVLQMAGRGNSEYIDVRIDDINARSQREEKLAEIEIRKKEISRQIELAEKERARLLKEVEKASIAIKEKPIEETKTEIPDNTPIVASPLDVSGISGPASLFGGLILAAVGARVALENRDEKQGELRLEMEGATKISGTQSENITETEDCTEVVSDFFLGNRVGGVVFGDTDSADEIQAVENNKKYTVVKNCTEDEIIKIGDKNETEVLPKVNIAESITRPVPSKSSDTIFSSPIVESDEVVKEEKPAHREKTEDKNETEALQEVNAGENTTSPALSQSSDTASSSSIVETDEIVKEEKSVHKEKIEPKVEEKNAVHKEEILNIEAEETSLEEENINTSSARGSASSSGLFTQTPSPVPNTTSGKKDMLALPCKIKVLAVGDGGAYAIDRMISAEQSKEVEFWAINTDLQALDTSKQKGARTFAIGQSITKGNGANGDPKVGENAAKESSSEIAALINGANVCIVKCGLGSGTGSGAAPVICELAKETGALTIAVVTEPFPFEGKRRLKQAVEAIDRLFEAADTVIVISNSNVLEIIPEDTSLELSFQVVDEFVNQVVIGLTNMLTKTGMSTVDFADVNGVLKESGFAVVGMGTGSEKTAAEDATVAALTSPLLDAPLDKARNVLVNVVGGKSLSLQKIDQALEIVNANFVEDCNIVVGAQVNEALPESTVSVTVIATSFYFDSEEEEQ